MVYRNHSNNFKSFLVQTVNRNASALNSKCSGIHGLNENFHENKKRFLVSYLRYDVVYLADEEGIKNCTYVVRVRPPIMGGNYDGTTVDLHVYKYFEPVEYKGKIVFQT
jgi:hypothetical protein